MFPCCGRHFGMKNLSTNQRKQNNNSIRPRPTKLAETNNRIFFGTVYVRTYPPRGEPKERFLYWGVGRGVPMGGGIGFGTGFYGTLPSHSQRKNSDRIFQLCFRWRPPQGWMVHPMCLGCLIRHDIGEFYSEMERLGMPPNAKPCGTKN